MAERGTRRSGSGCRFSAKFRCTCRYEPPRIRARRSWQPSPMGPTPRSTASSPEIKWRMTSSFRKSLDTIYGGADQFAKYVAEMTDNKFQVQVFAAGEIVPGLQALDATSNGTVEMSHTVSYYYVGKDPTFAIYASVPFGLYARQQNSCSSAAGGRSLGNTFYPNFARTCFPRRHTAPP